MRLLQYFQDQAGTFFGLNRPLESSDLATLQKRHQLHRTAGKKFLLIFKFEADPDGVGGQRPPALGE